MASSLAMNGFNNLDSQPQSSGVVETDDSEESFVVLSRSASADMDDQLIRSPGTLMNSHETIQSLPSITPMTDSVTNQVCELMEKSTVSSTSNSSTYELTVEEIQQKLATLMQENIDLKSKLNNHNATMKDQVLKVAQWKSEIDKVQQENKKKFEEMKNILRNLQVENAELKLEKQNKTSNEETLNLQSKISALEFELETLRQSNKKHKSEQTKIIQELELKLSESEKSKHEELNVCKNQIESLNLQLQTVEEHYNKIRDELAEVKTKVPTELELANNENMKSQLVEITQELLLKNKMLQEKTGLIDSLHEEISKIKLENETIPILKTQVEVYQSDFNQEREARNTLKAEKDRIAEDLYHLQHRNQKLLEQVEKMQNDRFVHVQSASNPSSRSSSTRTTPVREQVSSTTPPLATFMCPICSTKFRTLQAVQEHVENCLPN